LILVGIWRRIHGRDQLPCDRVECTHFLISFAPIENFKAVDWIACTWSWKSAPGLGTMAIFIFGMGKFLGLEQQSVGRGREDAS